MTNYPQPWSWQGATALVLAACIGGGWLTGVVLAALEARGEQVLDAELAGLLNGIGQVLAGALATYLGFAAGRAHPRRFEPPTGRTAPPGE